VKGREQSSKNKSESDVASFVECLVLFRPAHLVGSTAAVNESTVHVCICVVRERADDDVMFLMASSSETLPRVGGNFMGSKYPMATQ
jgi:hypothetical protein